MCDGGVRGRRRREGSPRTVALDAPVRRDTIRPVGEGARRNWRWWRSLAGVPVVGVGAHTRGMAGSEPAMLDWVSAETAYALDDLQVLACRVLVDGEDSDWHRGVTLTIGWLHGGAGPVTLRDEQPVTRGLVNAERWAAIWVDTDGPKLSLRDDCERFGVAYWEPVVTSRLWARGAETVLAWLLANPLEQRRPPMPVPERNAEGAVATAEELYQRELSAAPHAHWGPEERRAARTRAEVAEIRSQRLAALVEDSLRRAAGS